MPSLADRAPLLPAHEKTARLNHQACRFELSIRAEADSSELHGSQTRSDGRLASLKRHRLAELVPELR